MCRGISRVAIGLCLAVPLALSGCGGSGSRTQAREPSGQVVIRVSWPELACGPAGKPIPHCSRSIVVRITDPGDAPQTDLTSPVLLQRPDAAPWVTEETMKNVTACDSALLTAKAYPNRDGTGTAQAQGSMRIVIPSGGIAYPVGAPGQDIVLTINSTIAELVIEGPDTVQVPDSITLTATARNENGDAVLVECAGRPHPFEWSIESGAEHVELSVDDNGNAVVKGHSEGTTVIKASLRPTEAEDLVLATRHITVLDTRAVTFSDFGIREFTTCPDRSGAEAFNSEAVGYFTVRPGATVSFVVRYDWWGWQDFFFYINEVQVVEDNPRGSGEELSFEVEVPGSLLLPGINEFRAEVRDVGGFTAERARLKGTSMASGVTVAGLPQVIADPSGDVVLLGDGRDAERDIVDVSAGTIGEYYHIQLQVDASWPYVWADAEGRADFSSSFYVYLHTASNGGARELLDGIRGTTGEPWQYCIRAICPRECQVVESSGSVLGDAVAAYFNNKLILMVPTNLVPDLRGSSADDIQAVTCPRGALYATDATFGVALDTPPPFPERASLLWSEDFDAYPVNTYIADVEVWQGRYGASASRDYVTDECAVSSPHCLRVGGWLNACWADRVYRELHAGNKFIVDAYLRASGEGGYGCHDAETGVRIVDSLTGGIGDTDIVAQLCMSTEQDARRFRAQTVYDYTDGDSTSVGYLGAYSAEQWYKCTVAIDLDLGLAYCSVEDGPAVQLQLRDDSQCNYLVCSGEDGWGWIDDIEVWRAR